MNENEKTTEDISEVTESTETNETTEVADTSDSPDAVTDKNGKDKKPTQTLVSELFDYVEIFVIAVFTVIIMFTFFTRLCRVDGPSMENTLEHNEMLFISNLFYSPQQGDIIVFHQTGSEYNDLNEPIVKRVIAKGGEWVDIDFDTWTVRVADNEQMENAVTLDEPYIKLVDYPLSSSKSYPVHVPEGYLFVMGDNRNHSSDSRGSVIDLVDERRVLGHVVFRVSPFDKLGVPQ